MTVLVLAGGVGGAKFAAGLAQVLPPDQLQICVNTGDDFQHLGLPVSPDLDTVMYTLAGLNDTGRGWGLAGETWNFIDQISSLEGDDWFLLGDRDLATHVMRRYLRDQGLTLSEITNRLCSALGIAQSVFPMTEDPVGTIVHTDAGALEFQQYFVREKCQPKAHAIEFAGIEKAQPTLKLSGLLRDPGLEAVLIAPSNPYVSIDPILGLSGIRNQIRALDCPVIAVSPIINGKALKGPAGKMMVELGVRVGAAGVAAHFTDILDGFVFDATDVSEGPGVLSHVGHVLPTQTVMRSANDRKQLAEEVLQFAQSLKGLKGGNSYDGSTDTYHTIS